MEFSVSISLYFFRKNTNKNERRNDANMVSFHLLVFLKKQRILGGKGEEEMGQERRNILNCSDT
jgi:hypothetical protein